MNKRKILLIVLLAGLFFFMAATVFLISDLRKPLPGNIARPLIYSCKAGDLKWFPVEKASGYEVFEKADGKWEKTGTTESTGYQVKDFHPGTEYTVRGFKKYGLRETAGGMAYPVSREGGHHDLKIIFEGDSIIYGFAGRKNGRSRMTMEDRITMQTDAVCRNKAVSGRTAAICRKDKVVSMYRALKHERKNIINRNIDIVMIGLGTNDYKYDVPLGKPGSKAGNTFYGAYKYIVYKLKQQYPKAKIVLMTPMEREEGWNAPNDIGYTLDQYRRAVIRIAAGNGALVYDARKENLVNENNVMRRTADGLHPTEYTYQMIGDSLVGFYRDNGLLR